MCVLYNSCAVILYFPTVPKCINELPVTAEAEKRQGAASIVSYHRWTERCENAGIVLGQIRYTLLVKCYVHVNFPFQKRLSVSFAWQNSTLQRREVTFIATLATRASAVALAVAIVFSYGLASASLSIWRTHNVSSLFSSFCYPGRVEEARPER